MEATKIALFKGKKIRKTIHNNEWWFSVVDVVEALTDSVNARDYWFKMKIRVKEEDGFEPSTICRQFKLQAPDGKMRETDCSNTEGIFRIIQSIPSPKAEPFKRWLAKVGYERIQEIENPELATKRTRMLYKLKGLKRENLRDHMDDFELIFNMLGERSTTEIHRTEDSQGMNKLKSDAKAGGDIAGNARKQLEKRLGKSVVTKNNFLKQPSRKKKLSEK
ncbi:MAG: Bro-N domain-containing protein [Thermodesulfovibrionales bacterium]|nr:Bro-N domain-containing protein [Thermodesulfovibrionales bacterium]